MLVLRNIDPSLIICIIIGQFLGFGFVDHPERDKRVYKHASELADFVDSAAASHPHLIC